MRADGTTGAARTARRLSVTLLGWLAACTAFTSLRSGAWPSSAVVTLVLLVPLGLPLRGLLRGDRRTYAWATLCIAPYFVYGITETIANPAVRVLSGVVLLSSLALFVALVAYLRFTRPVAPQDQ